MFASSATSKPISNHLSAAPRLQGQTSPPTAIVPTRAPSRTSSLAFEDCFDADQDATQVAPATGLFSFLKNIPERLEQLQERNDLLNNLNAAIPYAFPQNGKVLYEFFWQGDAANEKERSDKLWDVRPRNLFNFLNLLESSLNKKYRGERVKNACRMLLSATLGVHQNHRSAVLALHRLYLRQHSDRALGRTWTQKSDEDDYNCVFQALNTVKTILNTDGLKDELFAPDVPSPSVWQKTSAFFLG